MYVLGKLNLNTNKNDMLGKVVKHAKLPVVAECFFKLVKCLSKCSNNEQKFNLDRKAVKENKRL